MKRGDEEREGQRRSCFVDGWSSLEFVSYLVTSLDIYLGFPATMTSPTAVAFEEPMGEELIGLRDAKKEERESAPWSLLRPPPNASPRSFLREVERIEGRTHIRSIGQVILATPLHPIHRLSQRSTSIVLPLTLPSVNTAETSLPQPSLSSTPDLESEHGFLGADEGSLAAEKNVSDDSESPDVLLLSRVFLSSKDLGRGVYEEGENKRDEKKGISHGEKGLQAEEKSEKRERRRRDLQSRVPEKVSHILPGFQ